MSLIVILGSLAVASAVPLLAFSALAGRSSGRRISRNLAAGLAVPGDLRQMVLARPARERALGPVVEALARRGRRLTPTGTVEATERRLHLAGDPWALERFMASKFVLTAMAAGASLAWAVADPSPATVLLVPAAIAAAALAPEALLAHKARERQDLILLDLPDTLDELTICVEAGLAFDAAMARVVASARGPLGDELGRVLQDVQIGIPRSEALRRLAQRTDVPEVRQFIHTVGQAESYGVPIASVLRSQADEQREKRAARAEERAQKMAVKLVFPLVLCILPSLFVVVLGPAALRLLRVFG